jgi:hypothetical protein
MKERPILFSGPMVQAIIEGRKTQTRRAVKPQPPEGAHPFHILVSSSPRDEGKWRFTKSLDHLSGTVLGPIACPYGVPGDRLWVRETYCEFTEDSPDRMGAGFYYRADLANQSDSAAETMRLNGVKWRPSIFMPRRASRILLEITGVRVERLQDISEDDARAEGVTPDAFEMLHDNWGGVLYRRLWEQINGAGSWDANPLVWVVSFRRVEAK